ncbi:MAG: exo-alpha-sialidase [Alphaproteobacteria bacterium]|nr:exo-alpha-sialidase [Alphaproteobacteria bacterium]
MKIYGQSLREIFDKLPWTYKIVVTVSCFFILFVMIYAPSVLLSPIKKAKKDIVKNLSISGASKKVEGIFDPSISYDRKSRKVWMAYTVKDKLRSQSGGMLVHVRLASSLIEKNCKSWVQVNGGFEGKSDDILGANGQTVFRSGTWRVETPTLVHDPEDKGREWKLYAYKYFWDNDPTHALQLARRYGMIVYKYATDPAESWSTEQWLFSPAYGQLPPPYGQMAMIHLNDLNESLKNVEVYSRPSVIIRDGMLVMTLSAFTKGTSPDRIIMIVSGDHGKSWKYIGTPLRVSDLEGIEPYTRLSGASLIEQDGVVYLAAVLGDAQQHGKGTFIFSFDDFKKGHLKRDPKTGVPSVLRHVPLYKPESVPIGGGFAAYSDVCPFGLLTSEQIPGTEKFRLLKTYENPAL